jgi:hypothetical protein
LAPVSSAIHATSDRPARARTARTSRLSPAGGRG